jgi:hypothetical protein
MFEKSCNFTSVTKIGATGSIEGGREGINREKVYTIIYTFSLLMPTF